MGHSGEVASHTDINGPCPHKVFRSSQRSLARNGKETWLVVRVNSPPSLLSVCLSVCLCLELSFGGNMLDCFELLVALSLVTWELRGITFIPK